MDTNTKTPVDIIQELLAILSTRKEVAEKLAPRAEDLGSALADNTTQSDQFIAALMEELSHFGDAVQGETDRENEYQILWQKAFKEIETVDPASTFAELEAALRNQYKSIESQHDLPESLQKLLADQSSSLQAGSH